jgi:tRNA (Thr-GGU) A37 N-methylase
VLDIKPYTSSSRGDQERLPDWVVKIIEEKDRKNAF